MCKKEKRFPKRKLHRLKDFDYSTAGGYYITVCTQDRKCILGSVCVGQGLAPAKIKLSYWGTLVDRELLSLQGRFLNVIIDKYVIMPNHIHIIFILKNVAAGASPYCLDHTSPRRSFARSRHLRCRTRQTGTAGASPCPTISDVMSAFKSLATRACKINGFKYDKLFQTSYYDHIIRDEKDYQEIWHYIDTNPDKWIEDKYYIE